MISAIHDAAHAWLATGTAGLRDHLVFSTALLVAMLAVSMFPSLSSRTRYGLVFLGVARFLIPGAALSSLVSLPIPALSLPSFSMTATTGTAAQGGGLDVLCPLAALWLAGAAVFTLQLVSAQRRWRRTLRQATAASPRETTAIQGVAGRSGMRDVPRIARSSEAIPMTGGWLRPVVLLPASCVDELDDDELNAVLAHELGHVERRHNLAALVQSVVLALFWFHPVLWVAVRKLESEAEKDCDERGVHFVSDPARYLSGMLKVSYEFIAPRRTGVSCMSRTRLKERMDHMIRHHESKTHSIPHRLAIGAGLAVLVLTTLFLSAGETPSAAGGTQKADVTVPKLLKRVEPVYPPSAKEQGLEGNVILTLSVDKKGIVSDVSVVKGVEGDDLHVLEEAAIAAVKQWTFEPAQKDGQPVPITFTVTIRFKLG